jgi:hypothetical protein
LSGKILSHWPESVNGIFFASACQRLSSINH